MVNGEWSCPGKSPEAGHSPFTIHAFSNGSRDPYESRGPRHDVVVPLRRRVVARAEQVLDVELRAHAGERRVQGRVGAGEGGQRHRVVDRREARTLADEPQPGTPPLAEQVAVPERR